MSYPSIPCQPCSQSTSNSCNPCTANCTDTFKSDCIVYTGSNILAGASVIVTQNSSMNSALAAIVAYAYSIAPSGTINPSTWNIGCITGGPYSTMQSLTEAFISQYCTLATTVSGHTSSIATNTANITTLTANQYKVKSNSSDTTADYLLNKLQSTDGSVVITASAISGNIKANLSAIGAVGSQTLVTLNSTNWQSTTVGTSDLQVTKSANGLVTITGNVTSKTTITASNGSYIIGTLPIGYYPQDDVLFYSTILNPTTISVSGIVFTGNDFLGYTYLGLISIITGGYIELINAPVSGTLPANMIITITGVYNSAII